MAEFVEVMENMKRMCLRTDCSVCPIHNDESVCDYCGEHQMLRYIDYEKLYEIVMEWAKEHPKEDE